MISLLYLYRYYAQIVGSETNLESSMRVFVTGATGFIGSAVVKELIAAGHEVLGLSRSKDKSLALMASGAQVLHGSIEDDQLLTRGAADVDGVIHLAFNHDFSRFVANCEDDRRVIKALSAGLTGSTRPLVVTSGTGLANTVAGESAQEHNSIVSAAVHPRAATEEAAAAAAVQGVNVSVVRLPQVHDPVVQGLITPAIAAYRQRAICVYIGEGLNRWPAAHVLDTARLYRLALEKGEPNAKYHAVAEEGVTLRDIATTIGQRLNLPVKSITADEAPAYFGWLSMFAGSDVPASSLQTRKKLSWEPIGPTLLADLARLSLPAP
jgi:nucleoside-diphosphate-sugar epimerase